MYKTIAFYTAFNERSTEMGWVVHETEMLDEYASEELVSLSRKLYYEKYRVDPCIDKEHLFYRTIGRSFKCMTQ